jgi:hypothetical protein
MSANDNKHFFDAHPGRGGCPLSLQTEVRDVARELNGRILSLEEAFNRIRAVARGEVEIKDNLIGLTVRGPSIEYFWVVIRFR